MPDNKKDLINKILAIKFLPANYKKSLESMVNNMDVKELKAVTKQIDDIKAGDIKKLLVKLEKERIKLEKENKKMLFDIQNKVDKFIIKMRKETEAAAINKLRGELQKKS